MISAQNTFPFSVRPDWPVAQARWKAFWDRQPTDRPCLDIMVPRPTSMPKPVVPESMEARWMDPEYIAAKCLYYFASHYFLGEAVPAVSPGMIGTTTGCGSNIIFSEIAIDYPICMQSINDEVPWHPGPGDPWRVKVDMILNRLLDLAAGKFMVGHNTWQYLMSDFLPMLRGTEGFMLDLIDAPDVCLLKLKEMFPLWLENQQHFESILDRRQGPCGTVLDYNTWSPDRVMSTQADMSLMISRETFDRFVLAELDMLAEHYDYLWYHACGCKRHLVSLLTRPYIRAIQYAPSPKEHDLPVTAHIAFYCEIQAAGRCVDMSVSAKGVGLKTLEYVIRHLSPEGLVIHTSVETPEKAEQLLVDAVKWSGSDCHASI